MPDDNEQGPNKVSGKLVLMVLLLIAIGMTVLTAVFVGDDFDPLAKPPDSSISDRDLVVE